MKTKILGALAGVGTFLAAAPAVFAQAITPAPQAIPPAMEQLAVDGVVSVQQGFFSVVALVWPYVLVLILGFLAIRYGMSMIFRRGA
jgi:hypothetical protein